MDNRILLMGNPNVGKSIFFTELTGIHAISSNYAGTTVSFMEGRVKLGDKGYNLVDVPGTYSLSPTSEAETVAASFMKEGAAAVICVLDASNLERNLHLALELKAFNIPIVYTLNLMDVAERHGIAIDTERLSRELGGPVIPTVAVKTHGLGDLKDALAAILSNPPADPCYLDNPSEETIEKCTMCPACALKDTGEETWEKARRIANNVITKNPSSPGFLDRLGEAMMRPMPGLPIAVLVMLVSIAVVVFGGRGLRAGALLPLVNGVIVPFFRNLFSSFIPEGIFLNVLIGEFGIFVISFEWILALIFPYVLMFYVVFTFLEDTGFLPRMSVLFDNVMRNLGVQGGSLIHIIMGFGCAVPAIIGSRAATSRKERIVISAAICFAIPCISQTGAIIALLGAYSWWMMPAMFLFALCLFVVVTLIAGKFVKGRVDPLLLEIPNLLMPNGRSYGRKIATRMKHFLREAEIPMMIAILIAALLSETGLLAAIAIHAQPIVSVWLGLPEDAVIALILGIIRREMSVAPLLALDLNALQAFVGGAVSLMYLPCLSVFAILAKEFKVRVAVIISVSTVFVAIFTGGLINRVVSLFM